MYVAIENKTKKPENQQSRQQGFSGGKGGDGKTTVQFAFHGPFDKVPEKDKGKAMRYALECAYCEITGASPDDATSVNDDELKKRISSHYQALNPNTENQVILTIVKIDPRNKAASFAEALDNIGSFTEISKGKLVADAFKALPTLDASKDKGKAVKQLCDALVKIERGDGFSLNDLTEEQQSVVEEALKDKKVQAAMQAARDRNPEKVTKEGRSILQKARPTQRADDRPTPPEPGSVRKLQRKPPASDTSRAQESDASRGHDSDTSTEPDEPIKNPARKLDPRRAALLAARSVETMGREDVYSL